MILKLDNQKSSHLNLDDRKRLLVRLHFARNLDADPLDGDKALTIVNSMRKNACGRAENTEILNSSFPLDLSLKDVFIDAKKACPKKSESDPDNYESQIRKRTARFWHDIREINCSRCGKERDNHICDGNKEADNEAVKNMGECWKPLQELFDYTIEATEKTYCNYAHGFSEAGQIKIGFKTIPSEELIIEPTTKFEYDQKKSRHCSVATIGLPVQNFNAELYFEMLYALFHELMVHSVQSIFISRKRTVFGEDCSFGEGLVDAVAYHILEQLLNEPDQLPLSIRPFASRFQQHALFSKTKRRIHTGKSKNAAETVAKNARSQGRDAFDFLLSLHNNNWLFELVLSLNLESLNKVERAELVSLMDKARRNKTQALSSEQPVTDIGLFNALDKYVETGNLQDLRSSILELKP